MRKRPTLADVAKAAGVSKTTVSIALNGREVKNVSELTRARIVAVARTLGFRPHGVARALSRRRADVLGVVGKVDPFIHESQHRFEHGLLSSIFRRTLERGYNPLIYGFPREDDDEHVLTRYADGRSDAFLLVNPPVDCPLAGYLRSTGMPFVSICNRGGADAFKSWWVDSDNEAGVRALVDHLAALGHRRIAYFTGPPNEDNVRTRTHAFRAALAAHGLPVYDDMIARFYWDDGRTGNTLAALMSRRDRPTALLAWNDYVAEDLCRRVRELGLRVPEDVSIAGFDDTPQARTADPPLTTVRQELDALGRNAVDLALEALCGEEDEVAADSARSILCPVRLVVRDSTAPAREPTP